MTGGDGGARGSAERRAEDEGDRARPGAHRSVASGTQGRTEEVRLPASGKTPSLAIRPPNCLYRVFFSSVIPCHTRQPQPGTHCLLCVLSEL